MMKKYFDDINVCVFVANLPSNLTDVELSDRLRTLLTDFGRIVSVKTSRDGKGRPFSFVQFEGQVIDFLLTETVTIEDRVLRFERAKSRNLPQQQQQSYQQIVNNDHSLESYESKDGYTDEVDDGNSDYPSNSPFKIFVGRLNGDLITQRKLLRRFQHHGHICDIELFKRNIDGTPRRDAFAFISYLNEEQQFKAIKEENDQIWLGQRLKCCKALPKRETAASWTHESTQVDQLQAAVKNLSVSAQGQGQGRFKPRMPLPYVYYPIQYAPTAFIASAAASSATSSSVSEGNEVSAAIGVVGYAPTAAWYDPYQAYSYPGAEYYYN